MSNPADNSGGCEVCGLDRQVLGCRPGKCKNEKAPPLGYTKCPTPGCPRWMGPNRLKCWSETLGGNSGVIYPDWEPPAPAAPEHPLPWRYSDTSGEELMASSREFVGYLVDADGRPLTSSGWVASPYVRAVTERSGAMEALLRSWRPPADWDEMGEVRRRFAEFNAARVALLAEIDAAAKGGG